MEPWYKVVVPRKELREGRSLDPSEFAVHLEAVVAGTAPRDYVDPAKFFSRNFFSSALVEHCGTVLRRLNGDSTNTAPVLSLITQFGGGKTHTLTAIYHLVTTGPAAEKFDGVAAMMAKVGLKTIPEAKAAIFVGNAWDPKPGQETPWLDIAEQLAGAKGRELLGNSTKAPGTKAIGELLRAVNAPVLILFDETLNYISRHPDQATQFHAFMQNLTVALTSADRAVGLFSLPASPTEMTDPLREWQERLTKVVGRVGKDLVANDASEVSEIIRRRLFEDSGRDSMRKAVARQYARWVFERRDRMPSEWANLSEDQIRTQFEACYPFHPSTLTVFQRKWSALAQFQQTRSTLAMLGMWISTSYRDGYGKARRESLLTLGSAPLEDRDFLSAVLRQTGQDRLKATIQADIAAEAGQPLSHADSLDEELSDGAGKTRIARRVAAALFFESSGGQTDRAAHLPELYFAVGDPETETTLVHTTVQSLEKRCYFLRAVGVDGWRFGHAPTLRKIHADRRAGLDPDVVRRQASEAVRQVFKAGTEVPLALFPKGSSDVADQPTLVMAVLSPDDPWEDSETSEFNQRLTEWTRKCGQQVRQHPGGLIWLVNDESMPLRSACEDWMAWQAVQDDANRGTLGELDPEDVRRIQMELEEAKNQIEDRVWSGYSHILLWEGAEGQLKELSAGQMHRSEARNITAAILARMRHASKLSNEIGAAYIERNWPPTLKESGQWPLAGVLSAFFQGRFTRLIKATDALKSTIQRAIAQGTLGLASGKETARFDRVWFRENVDLADITFDQDVYLLTSSCAKKLKEIPAPGGTQIPPGGPTPPPGTPPEPPIPPVPPTPPVPKPAKAVVWSGAIKKDQWNLFSLKVLSRLAAAQEVQIQVTVRAKLPDAPSVESANMGLKDLGLTGSFKPDAEG
jgi:hypothetical protein